MQLAGMRQSREGCLLFFPFFSGKEKPYVPEGSSARQAMFIIAKEASRMDNEATNHSHYTPCFFAQGFMKFNLNG